MLPVIKKVFLTDVSNGSIRSRPPEMFLGKGVPKICSKFTREHPYQSYHAVSLKSYFGMGFLLKICCIFSEHLFLITPLNCCF